LFRENTRQGLPLLPDFNIPAHFESPATTDVYKVTQMLDGQENIQYQLFILLRLLARRSPFYYFGQSSERELNAKHIPVRHKRDRRLRRTRFNLCLPVELYLYSSLLSCCLFC
jgi:hypothetical protein